MALKKKFFSVDLPLLNTSMDVLAFSQQELVGKIIKYDLTRILRGKNIEATLIIKKENEKLIAELKSLRLLQGYITGIVGKGVSYVEDSFTCKSKDANLRIKPFMLTRKKVHRSIKKALRARARELIEEFAAKNNSDMVFSAVIQTRLQKELSSKLKKIYPLSFCEIRVIKKV